MNNFSDDIKDFAMVFDLIPDHVIITDSNGNIIYANKGVEDQTGYSKDEIFGKNPGKLWGGQMPKDFYAEMWKRIKFDKKPFVGEVKNKRKSGEEYWQELRIYPILDELREIKFFIAIEPNINARKTAEENLKENYDVVDRLNKFMVDREVRMVELKEELEKLRVGHQT